MYGLLNGYVMAFKIPRFMINTLVPFIVEDLGLPHTVTPTLLAAFHPGYITTQVPGGLVVRSKGAKFVAAVQLTGSALLLALLPMAGSLGGKGATLAMSAVMLGMGAFQGPMSPVQSQLSRDWMPDGVERAWAYRFLSLSHSSTPLLAALFTPRIAASFGWRTVCHLYAAAAGGYAALWMAFASNSPRKSKACVRGAPEKPRLPFDWRILRTKPALALLGFHIAADFGEFTRHQLAPTMYMQKFSCSPVQMGSYLAIGNAMHIPAGFIWAAIESWLIKRGTSKLSIRKGFTGVASAAESILSLLYALAPTPILATVWYGMIDAFFTMHTSGAWVNYLDVGAEDTATLNAVTNSIASSTAIVVPYLGFWLRARTGSWGAQIGLSMLIKACTGLLYVRWASVTSAREILAHEDAAKTAKTSSSGRC